MPLNLKKFDNDFEMEYNSVMEKITTAIIGGGASGLFLATALHNSGKTVLFERNDRLGKKLSATGNGQGNVTNLFALETAYFSHAQSGVRLAEESIREYDHRSLIEYFEQLGLLLIADERGRVYPAGRQASALTDGLRFALEKSGVEARLSTQITAIRKSADGFLLTAVSGEKQTELFAETVVLCAGGKAAKNFGTDGNGYTLARALGHTVTPLYPSLVQLKTDTTHTKTLKGIRVTDGGLTAEENGKVLLSLTGDIIFTEYGVSGDAVFRASAYVAEKIPQGNLQLKIDFLPQFTEEKIRAALYSKAEKYPQTPISELLCGMVNNQIGRAVMRRANGDIPLAAKLVKAFPLPVLGSLGFDYAQVTKGGVLIDEVDEQLQSKLVKGLYFTGEILDVDGPCGGFNLQWAYSSARKVADALNAKYAKGRGQV